MITIKLEGRTGNNFFQYAAGRVLAIRHATRLMLDGSWANAEQERGFRQLFSIPLEAGYRTRGRLLKHTLNKFGLKPYKVHCGPVHKEKSPAFDLSFFNLPDGVRLHGFYQSYRYFEHIESQLRSELDLSHLEIDSESRNFENFLRNQRMVSLHVRRGDYLGIPITQCLPGDYYELSIQHMRTLVQDPIFCVFSDDIPWCQNHFKGSDFLFCDLPGSHCTPLHDLRMMAACAHHIIVNSSYSWWGAWLNPRTNKHVILPKWWMTGLTSDDLTLPTWTQLDHV